MLTGKKLESLLTAYEVFRVQFSAHGLRTARMVVCYKRCFIFCYDVTMGR